jgi:hypothetical protein
MKEASKLALVAVLIGSTCLAGVEILQLALVAVSYR